MNNNTNQEIISTYLSWCENEKRFSGQTIATYFSALKAFRIYLDSNKLNILTLTPVHMREYFVTLNERKDLNKISVNDYRAVLKSFFKYLVNQKLMQDDPMVKVGRQKAAKPKRSVLNVKQLERLINKVDADGSFLFRDTVMFELFWNSGLRTTELSNLEERHLNIVTVKPKKDAKVKKTLRVYEVKVEQGKGKKDRFVTVGEMTTGILKKYLHAKKLLYPATEYLFPSSKGKKLNRRMVYSIISEFLNLSVSKKKGAHTLRHTYATMLLNNGVNIMAVKDLLGHSRVSTTTIYTKPSQEMLEREYHKAHPKGEVKKGKKVKQVIGSIKNYRMEA